jgi:hypothetical protein
VGQADSDERVLIDDEDPRETRHPFGGIRFHSSVFNLGMQTCGLVSGSLVGNIPPWPLLQSILHDLDARAPIHLHLRKVRECERGRFLECGELPSMQGKPGVGPGGCCGARILWPGHGPGVVRVDGQAGEGGRLGREIAGCARWGHPAYKGVASGQFPDSRRVRELAVGGFGIREGDAPGEGTRPTRELPVASFQISEGWGMSGGRSGAGRLSGDA